MQTTGFQVNKLPSRMWGSINQSAVGMNKTLDGALPSGRDSIGRHPSDWNDGMNSSEFPHRADVIVSIVRKFLF